MPVIGFHASHELYSPSALLRHVRQAEQAGFRAAMCSDHFHPWTPRQGQSGLSFAWLGAALQATSLPIGTICCPAGRYHPAVVAQAAATLEEMFPGRTWLALGTGEALNEHITGEPWPPKEERRGRVEESARVIRALWAGEEVTHRGRVRVDRARLYTRPATPPRLLGAALSEESARWAGSWADGLLTVSAEPPELAEVLAAFRAGGGAGKPVYVQAAVGYHPDEAEAWERARRSWPTAALSADEVGDLATPEAFEAATRGVRAEDLHGKLRVSSDLGRHRDWIRGDLELGVDAVYLHNLGGDPERFIGTFAEKVLPVLS